jgi:hypothetical protein
MKCKASSGLFLSIGEPPDFSAGGDQEVYLLARTVFVSSALPPQPSCVGDFAALLSEHWPDSTSGTSLHFVSRGAEQVCAAGHFPAMCEFENKPRALLDHLEACQVETVVLHYMARSYNKSGIPFWLGQVMTRWRGGGPRRRLLVYFHEIWNDSVPMYCKHDPLQLAKRIIFRCLLSASDAVIMNTVKRLTQLNNLKKGTPVTWKPDISNISPLEPSESKPGEWLLSCQIHPNELMRSHPSESNLADRANSLRQWYEANASWEAAAARVGGAL